MRIQHHDAINNERYCQNYYSPYHRIINEGGLCLVSELYYDFATKLMTNICSEITVDALLKKKKKNFISNIKEIFLKDEEFFQIFCNVDTNSSGSKGLNISDKKIIYIKIMTKVIHAKAGAVMQEIDEKFVGKGLDVTLRNNLKNSAIKRTKEIKKGLTKTNKRKRGKVKNVSRKNNKIRR